MVLSLTDLALDKLELQAQALSSESFHIPVAEHALCLSSHSLLWLCQPVHHSWSPCPLGHWCEALISHTASLYLALLWLVLGLLKRPSRQKTQSSTSLLSNLLHLHCQKWFPSSNMTSLLIMLKKLPVMFFLISNFLILVFKVLSCQAYY